MGASVTVVVPVLNEEHHLAACLDAVMSQEGDLIEEVLVLDGGSWDRTREIARSYEGVQVIDNPRRLQAAAMNLALEHARGSIIIRVDGHCRIAPDYVLRSVEALEATGAALVGGRMIARGVTPVQRAIAAALHCRLGAGGSAYHVSDEAGYVDIVYLGTYFTEVACELGGHLEMRANEDGEFAARASAAGGVWYDPAIRAEYVPRSRVRGLAIQFFHYGAGRATTARHHPRSVAARQLVAPALVLGLLSPWRRPVALAYLLLLAALPICADRRGVDPAAAVRLPLVAASMHLPWGVGFLVGLAPFRRPPA